MTETRQLAAYGVAVTVQPGWECRILRRSAIGWEKTHTVVHMANFALPEQRDDFGQDLTHRMTAGDMFVVLFEYGPDSVGQPLFAAQGMPTITPAMFTAHGAQRPLPGQLGCQRFFTANGRAFCIYALAGSRAAVSATTPHVNAGLSDLVIHPWQ
jgi:hypothetical protein